MKLIPSHTVLASQLSGLIFLLACTLFCLLPGLVRAASTPDEIRLLADAGHYRRALALIEPLAKAHPEDLELQFHWGEALLGSDRPEDAIDVLSRAVKKAPNNGLYRRVLGEAYRDQARRLFDSGASVFGIMRMMNVMRSARDQFEAAVRLDPQDLKAQVNLASFHIMAPAMIGGSLETAHAILAEIDRLDPVRGLRVRAMEAEHQGDVARAESLLLEAVELDAGIDSRMALGILLANAKRYEEAMTLFSTLAAGTDRPYLAWYQSGRTADLSQAHTEEGMAMLERYLAVEDLPDTAPSKGWAHYRLGNIQARSGDGELARTQYAAAGHYVKHEPALRQKLKESAGTSD